MENDVKKEAVRQYLRYFRVWFILIGLMAAACIVLAVIRQTRNIPRTNLEAPKERVFDYADVLTDKEEEKLREYIAETERKIHGTGIYQASGRDKIS